MNQLLFSLLIVLIISLFGYLQHIVKVASQGFDIGRDGILHEKIDSVTHLK
jgi:hypothetical protein